MKKTKKEKTEIEIDIDDLRKTRRANLTKGILKLSAPALTFVLGLGCFGMCFGTASMYFNTIDAKNTFYNDASFVQMQAEDLAEATEKLSRGEIDAEQFNREVKFIKSEKYLDNAMKDNQDYQALLKLEKAYNIMSLVELFSSPALLLLTIGLYLKLGDDGLDLIDEGLAASRKLKRLKDVDDEKDFEK